MKTVVFEKNVLVVIATLMFFFLILSWIANYLMGRTSFVILYSFIFVALLVHIYCFKKEQDLFKASKQISLILFALFSSFFLLGEQRSFDVMWTLVFPIVVLMISSSKGVLKWLIAYNLTIATALIVHYIYPDYINYDGFALWSLLWASIFSSYLSYNYTLIQEKMQRSIDDYQNNLEAKVQEAVHEVELLNHELKETQFEILERLGNLGEFRSQETGEHVKRVGLYTYTLSRLAGVSHENAELYQRAAPLHDIGKVGVSDAILHKPSKLTEEEYEIMKEHTLIGEKVLSGSNKPLIQIASKIAGAHHEKYDGSGYPRGLVGDAIPFAARVVAIADVFDALYSQRVYKKAWSIEEIVSFFEDNSAKHFDPNLVELFLEHIDQFITIFQNNNSMK